MLECLINYYTDGNKAAFSRMVTVTPQTLSKWIARNTFDNELLYSKCKGISAHWLLTGDGDMLADLSESQTVSNSITNVSGIMDKRTMLECLINHYTDGNKAAFARMINIIPQMISHWLRRNTFDNELLYSKCKGISANWLLTGEGEMLADPPSPSISQAETASINVTQTDINSLLAAKDEVISAKDEVIAALRQSLADKERLICTLLEARSPHNP